MNTYEYAKAKYASLGVDTEAAIERLMSVPVSVHCWQGDDVTGFDTKASLSGGPYQFRLIVLNFCLLHY